MYTQIVIDFTAVWCPPCRFIAPIFVELAKKHLDVVFFKVDVDELAVSYFTSLYNIQTNCVCLKQFGSFVLFADCCSGVRCSGHANLCLHERRREARQGCWCCQGGNRSQAFEALSSCCRLIILLLLLLLLLYLFANMFGVLIKSLLPY